MKRFLTGLLACLLAALLCACDVVHEYPPELPVVVSTPPPLIADEGTFQAKLYFADGSNSLKEELLEVNRAPGESYAKAALEALFESEKRGTIIDEGLSLSHVALSGNVCLVYLTGEITLQTASAVDQGSGGKNADASMSSPEQVRQRKELRFLTARAAIATTVAANQPGTLYTDVYLNGMQPGYTDRPLGLLEAVTTTLYQHVSEVDMEYRPENFISMEAANQPEVAERIRHNAALYFTDSTRRLLVGGARLVSYERKAAIADIAAILVDELSKGPVSGQGREPVLPADLKLIGAGAALANPDGTPLSAQSEASAMDALGGAVLELYFNNPGDSFDQALAYGALTYSLWGFCPNIIGVRIYHDGAAVNPAAVFPAVSGRNYFVAEDFSHLLGLSVPLQFPDMDGSGLHTVARSMKQRDAFDPLMRVRALFEGPADPGVLYPLFTGEDVQNVYIRGDLAVVDWAPGFFDKLTAMVQVEPATLINSTGEQMFLYGVVNTLCEIPGVQRVWMLEDAAAIPKTAAMIYLGSPLLKNPGLTLD